MINHAKRAGYPQRHPSGIMDQAKAPGAPWQVGGINTQLRRIVHAVLLDDTAVGVRHRNLGARAGEERSDATHEHAPGEDTCAYPASDPCNA